MHLHRLALLAGVTVIFAACARSSRAVSGGEVAPTTSTGTTKSDTALINNRPDSSSSSGSIAPGDTGLVNRRDSSAASMSGKGWSATLSAPADYAGTSHVTGTAMVMPGTGSTQTNVTVNLSGAAAGSTHPWHIHQGSCGNDKGIVGPASAYTPITIGANGNGSASATLPMAVPSSGSYFVNVHESPANMKTAIACGNLSMSGM